MDIRFVTRKIHAYLDYPVAFALIGLPFLLGLGASNPLVEYLGAVGFRDAHVADKRREALATQTIVYATTSFRRF
jgi:hypothetical protein